MSTEQLKTIAVKVTIEQRNILRGLAAKNGLLTTPYVTKIICDLADRNNPKKKTSLTNKK